MRNITEIVEEIIHETGKAESLKVLAKEIAKSDSGYKKFDQIELQALVHTTLSIDGRFVYINDC